MESLREISDRHRGKVSDKWSSYFPAYDSVLAPYRGDDIRLLEIGVQNGGSLEIWSKYFETAQHIVGCDISPACAALEFESPAVSVVVGDASSPDTYCEIDAICSEFDIAIDDGSHQSEHIICAFPQVFSRLRDGGLYVCEDLICAFQTPWGGGVDRPDCAAAFFRRVSDYVNLQHWNHPDLVETPMKFFEERFGLSPLSELLSHVHEVRFRNSMCIIEKRAPEQNTLGLRTIAGECAQVETEVSKFAGLTAAECFGDNRANIELVRKSMERRAYEARVEGSTDTKDG